MPRKLTITEIDELLERDVVARLATLDADGYPHVTPVWFLWTAGSFVITSYSDRPHVRRCLQNPRAGLVIDTEDELRADGERPNRQVRAVGDVVVGPDHERVWTRQVRRRYIGDGGMARLLDRWPDRDRSVITLTPMQIAAVASV